MYGPRRLTKIQATTRPDCLWLESWIDTSKAAKKQDKQEWAIEEPKLDSGRKLKGVYFIDREAEE